MTATIHVHVHPKNPDARMLGVRLGAGDAITRDVVFPAPSGSWLQVKSGAVGLRPNSDQGFFVRPAKTQTIEAPSSEEFVALRLSITDEGRPEMVQEALSSLLRKLEVGCLLTEIRKTA